jgi:Putative transposase
MPESSNLSLMTDSVEKSRFSVPYHRSELIGSGMIYAKPPFNRPATVQEYLGRYTHRVSIANSRLIEYRDGLVRSAGKTIGTTSDRRL